MDGDSSARIDTLLERYLEGDGCPCRYPRFRATARGEPRFAQQMLIALFAKKAPLADQRDVDYGWEARCSRCGSGVRQSTDTTGRESAFQAYLTIDKDAGLADLGAPVGPRVFAAESGEAWLVWMGERTPAAEALVAEQVRWEHAPRSLEALAALEQRLSQFAEELEASGRDLQSIPVWQRAEECRRGALDEAGNSTRRIRELMLRRARAEDRVADQGKPDSAEHRARADAIRIVAGHDAGIVGT